MAAHGHHDLKSKIFVAWNSGLVCDAARSCGARHLNSGCNRSATFPSYLVAIRLRRSGRTLSDITIQLPGGAKCSLNTLRPVT